MADIVSTEVRRRMMSGIRSKNTKPEMIVRKGLHRLGFRFRLHDKQLPGKPDLVFPKHDSVIFVHGCFWHGHGCHLFKWPKTRPEFWRKKIENNKLRDQRAIDALSQAGWKCLTFWECATKNQPEEQISIELEKVKRWLLNADRNEEIPAR
ncbi:very short patch repair endonuclease [Parasphingorhabdus marina]|uniref:very short patch repair endonuclease n=1 Tax=Parasphingorhabdus marina TaxID=394732 RepID=UPI0009417B77|nr:very short patch repair endonuclease [Parasphingorhabdus marina]